MDRPADPNHRTVMARRLAARFEDDEATMAWVLARLRQRTGATEAGIAARLGLAEDLVPRLALCNRPRSDLFREDVESIAEHFAIAPRRLADLVREVEGIVQFQPRSERFGVGGVLAAARDHVAEEKSVYGGPEPEVTVADERAGGDDDEPSRDPR